MDLSGQGVDCLASDRRDLAFAVLVFSHLVDELESGDDDTGVSESLAAQYRVGS